MSGPMNPQQPWGNSPNMPNSNQSPNPNQAYAPGEQYYYGPPQQAPLQQPPMRQPSQPYAPYNHQSAGQSQFGQSYGQNSPQQQPFDPNNPYQSNHPFIPTPAKKDKKNLILVAIAGILSFAAIAVLITAFLAPGWAMTKRLSASAVQNGVKKIMVEYGADPATVDNVSCPDKQEVKKDASFTCTLKIKGADQKVTVTFKDDSGSYYVAHPVNK